MPSAKTEHVTAFLAYRCRRCGVSIAEPHADPEVALRRAIEAGQLGTIHACEDGASGCAELVGTGPGRSWAERREAADVPRYVAG